MTADELAALASIKGFAAANRVSMTGHAITEMVAAGAQRSADWKVTGPDRDGDDLDCAVIVESGVLVVTVF